MRLRDYPILRKAYELVKPPISHEGFGGFQNFSAEEGNKFVADILQTNIPFSLIRMGFVELEVFRENEKFFGDPKHKYKYNMAFSSNREIDQYCTDIRAAYRNADMIVAWYNSRFEGKLIEKYGNNPKIIEARTVEPYYFKEPWSLSLEGKKVLVVAPFEEEILNQYKNREKLFEHNVLPEFDLKTVKSVWFFDGNKDSRFKTWFDALEYMKERIAGVEFDIALLGCGAMGTPLCNYIKELGKQAIYIGGAIQIMFGIKGARWDHHPIISELYNDYWIRPGEESKPLNSSKLDSSCYW